MVASSAEQRFYKLHQQKLVGSQVSPEQRVSQIRTPGDRYFCLTDFISAADRLSAIEWGFGGVSLAIALARFFGSYHAIDIAASEIASGRDLPFRYSDVNLNDDLPFPDESFDVSIAMMVIEHLFDPFHSFREIARTTKRNGIVAVNLPLVSSIRNRVLLALGDLPMTSSVGWWDNEEWDGGHLHYFTIPYIIRLAAKYRLALKRFYPVGRHLLLKRLAPSVFCHEGSFIFQRDG